MPQASHPVDRGVLRNIRWGIILGLFFAVYYSAIAIAIYLLLGPSAFDRNGITLLGAIMAYFTAGVVGGIVVGLFRPLVRSLLGRMAAGILVAVPVFLVIGVTADGNITGWTGDEWVALGISSVFLGIAGGYLVGDRQDN
ncbi:MAG: hypothetical protein ABR543_09875 [Gemmatimonadaceae bacterium]